MVVVGGDGGGDGEVNGREFLIIQRSFSGIVRLPLSFLLFLFLFRKSEICI